MKSFILAPFLALSLALFLATVTDYKPGVSAVDLLDYPCQDPNSNFSQSVLETHNSFRALHNNTAPLCLSQRLIDSAEQYAKKMAKIDGRTTKPGGYFDHDPNNKIEGENLCRAARDMCKKQGATHCVEKCIDQWYRTEEPHFNYLYKQELFNPVGVVGHFTSMVWRETRAVGCGIAEGTHGTFVVCRYYPQGNVIEEYTANIGDKIN